MAAAGGSAVFSDGCSGSFTADSLRPGVDISVLSSSCPGSGFELVSSEWFVSSGDGLGKYDDPSVEYPERSVDQGLFARKPLHRFKAKTNALPSFRGPALCMRVSNKTKRPVRMSSSRLRDVLEEIRPRSLLVRSSIFMSGHGSVAYDDYGRQAACWKAACHLAQRCFLADYEIRVDIWGSERNNFKTKPGSTHFLHELQLGGRLEALENGVFDRCREATEADPQAC